VDYEENGSQKSCHDFMTRKHPTSCHQNRATFFTASGQKKAFQKCVFHHFRPFQGSKSNSNTPNSSY